MRYEFVPYLALYVLFLMTFSAYLGQAARTALGSPSLLSRSRFVLACFWMIEMFLSFLDFVTRMTLSNPPFWAEFTAVPEILCLTGLVCAGYFYFWNYFKIPLPTEARFLFLLAGALYPVAYGIDASVPDGGFRFAVGWFSVFLIVLQAVPCMFALLERKTPEHARKAAAGFLLFFLAYAGFNASSLILGGRHFMDYDLLFAFVWAVTGLVLMSREERVKPATGEVPEVLAVRFDWTSRELEAVRYLLEGAGNKQIARTMGITEGTVKAHLYNLYRKAGINSRLELINLVYSVRSSEPVGTYANVRYGSDGSVSTKVVDK